MDDQEKLRFDREVRRHVYEHTMSEGLPPTVEAAAAAIRADPEITRCAAPDCRDCADAIAGGPILDAATRIPRRRARPGRR
jgi:hypothetical protein